MRIWDIDPGYLNRQSLLGEHRELHGIVSIITNSKKGYSRHPETLRWVGFGWALKQRHALLAAEMSLRGFRDRTPVRLRSSKGVWPEIYIDHPVKQFQILKTKYTDREQGRIPLPKNAQQLWSQHKYSVLARDANLYKKTGRELSGKMHDENYSLLVKLLVEVLRKPPATGGIKNALQHMWGHVSDDMTAPKGEIETWSLKRLLSETQHRAKTIREPFLQASTALGELAAWMPTGSPGD